MHTNIPKPHPILKSPPFPTLPRQFQTIHQYIIHQNNLHPPLLSHHQLSHFNFPLHHSFHLNHPVLLHYYHHPYFKSIQLNIQPIHPITFQLQPYPSHSSDKFKLSLLHILPISP
ncbi:YolD-like family protein, partial [Staphylococcus warneri]|uniref:YolD-like family protein n=1 Tax=Staphylococcus warneri TaxID=1292 RepID=UPI0021BDB11F